MADFSFSKIPDSYIREHVRKCIVAHKCSEDLSTPYATPATDSIKEAFTDTDEKRIRTIVRSEIKDDKTIAKAMQEISINTILSLFRALYLKRSIFRSELNNQP